MNRDVYSSLQVMRSYMVALALSYFLWPHHYRLYSFFLETIAARRGRVASYLEIGPGHGLFLAAALEELGAERYVGVDLSSVSLDMTRSMLRFSAEGRPMPSLLHASVDDFAPSERFDFITMGEVIEHLDDPRPILRKIATM